MPRYRVIHPEIEAFQCADGSYLLATDPPSAMTAEDFEATYEPVEERRAAQRRTTSRAKEESAERRKGGRVATPWTCTNPECAKETTGPKCQHCGKWKPRGEKEAVS